MADKVVTMKENHDSLWVKVNFPNKTWVKFRITRSTIGLSGNVDLSNYPAKLYVDKANSLYKSLGSKLTYGELIKKIGEEWSDL